MLGAGKRAGESEVRRRYNALSPSTKALKRMAGKERCGSGRRTGSEPAPQAEPGAHWDHSRTHGITRAVCLGRRSQGVRSKRGVVDLLFVAVGHQLAIGRHRFLIRSLRAHQGQAIAHRADVNT